MNTRITITKEEIISLSKWNKRASERWAESVAANPDRDPETLLRLESERPHPWNGWTVTSEGDVDPIIINTHGVDPFPDNQGTVEFDLTSDQLRGALEDQTFHLLKQGDGWDYGRTLTNVSWKKQNDDWGLVDPDPSKIWITKRDQIEDGKKYHITCIGGWGYVFINLIDEED